MRFNNSNNNGKQVSTLGVAALRKRDRNLAHVWNTHEVQNSENDATLFFFGS